MRVFALAVSAALGVALMAGAAQARPFADQRLQMEVPNSGGWSIVDGSHQQEADRSYVETAAPDDDCAFFVIPADIPTASRARTAIAEDRFFTPTYLGQIAGMFPRIIPVGATVQSQNVETTGPWPIRRVTFAAGQAVAHVAIQWRPGVQLIAACARYQGAASQPSRYDAIFRSVSHPNDATWLAQAQSEAQAQPQPQPQQQQQEQPQQEQQRRRR